MPARQYRFAVAGKSRGPWRDTREAAELDALKAKEAHQDEHDKVVYLSPLTSIEVRDRPC